MKATIENKGFFAFSGFNLLYLIHEFQETSFYEDAAHALQTYWGLDESEATGLIDLAIKAGVLRYYAPNDNRLLELANAPLPIKVALNLAHEGTFLQWAHRNHPGWGVAPENGGCVLCTVDGRREYFLPGSQREAEAKASSADQFWVLYIMEDPGCTVVIAAHSQRNYLGTLKRHSRSIEWHSWESETGQRIVRSLEVITPRNPNPPR